MDWKQALKEIKSLTFPQICTGFIFMLPAICVGITRGCWISCHGADGTDAVWYENPLVLAIFGFLALYVYSKITAKEPPKNG